MAWLAGTQQEAYEDVLPAVHKQVPVEQTHQRRKIVVTWGGVFDLEARLFAKESPMPSALAAGPFETWHSVNHDALAQTPFANCQLGVGRSMCSMTTTSTGDLADTTCSPTCRSAVNNEAPEGSEGIRLPGGT
jgi:hypothetical protein